MGLPVWAIVEEHADKDDTILRKGMTHHEAQLWLTYYLNHGHDAYMQLEQGY